VTPIPLVGEVNVMGLEEAESRNEQFGHTGIGSITSMDDELTRLREHIKDLGLR
jgi:hypothetical protein